MIVASSPLFVGRPNFRHRDDLESKPYSQFRADNVDRRPMVYVGANDGMLHAINGNQTASSQGPFYFDTAASERLVIAVSDRNANTKNLYFGSPGVSYNAISGAELRQRVAEELLHLAAAQADDVGVLLLGPRFVIMLVALEVHQVEFVDQAALAEIKGFEARGDTTDPRYMELLIEHHYVEHVLRMPFDQWPEPVHRILRRRRRRLADDARRSREGLPRAADRRALRGPAQEADRPGRAAPLRGAPGRPCLRR